MSNAFFDFLKDVKIEEVPKSTRAAGVSRKQVGPAPSIMALRIWKDGSIYPSKLLVDTYGLEYPKATITENTSEDGKKTKKYDFGEAGPGNGLDVIDSPNWAECKGAAKPFIAIAVVQKSEPKVDLFANTRYNEDGTPVSSVLEQGAVTFGEKKLLPMLKEIYGVEPDEETGYIDLVIDTNINLKAVSPSGIFNFPKSVARGAHKDKPSYERRENVDIFPLAPITTIKEAEEVAGATQENGGTEEDGA